MGRRKNTRQKGAQQQENTTRHDRETLLQRAYQYHKQGKTRQAEQAYGDYTARYPQHAEALGNFGLFLHSQNQPARAIPLYQQAMDLAPHLDHLYYYLGNGLREVGRSAEAIAAYQKGLTTTNRREATQLHLGLAYSDMGQDQEARNCFEAVLEKNPEQIQASYFLGLLYFHQDHFSRAASCFAAVLETQPQHVDACFNLALCHKARKEYDLALESLNKAHGFAPDDADIIYNIGVIYNQLHNPKRAEEKFLQALNIDPQNGICLTDLAILYHRQNRLAESQAMYERATICDYHPDSARHMLSALKGETTTTTPLQHVADLFDNYAEDFDDSLQGDLRYVVPSQLADSLRTCLQGKVLSTALDLGCGTGLSGLAFRDLATSITGVDISRNMLRRAEGKTVYDALHCTDIIDFLQDCQERYELVIATDVFVYLGQLDAIFELVERAIKPGGFLLFSVESCSEGYRLRQSGRYAHGADYVAKLAQDYHFTIQQHQPAGIRFEREAWIPGALYILQR